MPSPIPSRRLRGWKLSLFIASIVVFLLFGLIALPFVIAESFERVVDEARALGIPGSFDETGRRGDPLRQRATTELASLLHAVSLYEVGRSHPTMSLSPNSERTRLYRAVPAETVQRAVELAHELREVSWSGRPAPSDPGENAVVRKLLPLLCDRWLFDEFDEPDAEAVLLLDLARSLDPIRGEGNRVPILLALRARLSDLRDPAAMADRLRRFADERWLESIRAAHARFALQADFLRDPMHEARARGIHLPNIAEHPFTLNALVRLAGADVLRHGLRNVEVMRTVRDPVALKASFDASPPKGAASRILGAIMGTQERHLIQSTVHAEMLARTLAWRLDGKEHPVDQWDPAKRPLRALERDGRIMALYSVGRDGLDDGGVLPSDLVWWLEPEPMRTVDPLAGPGH